MSKIVTYIEIDIESFDSPPTVQTFRFANDADYLPLTIAAIPSIKEIAIQPQVISLGQTLGQRGNITVTFKDHLHKFASESFEAGSFWGKFRARYGQTLQGESLRLIRGTVDQTIEAMETRHFVIDSTNGPSRDRTFQIIAKDALSLATGGLAQAPTLSNGFLSAGISAGSTSLTLSPTGVGDEYPASGTLNVSGTEAMSYSRSGDTFSSLTRGVFGTTATAHAAGDRAQFIKAYSVQRPVDILYDLLTTYGGIDTSFITQGDWQAENDAYLNIFFTGYLADPKPVDQIASEIIEQAGLAVWWDDLGQKIRLQVLREIPSTAAVYDEDSILRGTIEVTEQPEKRLSDVQVYFAQTNPLAADDQDSSYLSQSAVNDSTAVTEYGTNRIKKIRSRWIQTGGETAAESTANKQLGRYRDPPRNIKFSLPRDQPADPQLGGGYQLSAYPFQTSQGVADQIPIQIIRLNPKADRFDVEAEEILFTQFGAVIDPLIDTVIFDVNANNVTLQTVHDTLYPVAVSGDTVKAYVNAGVIIGSTTTGSPAMTIGTFAAGVTVQLFVNGRIQGCGGAAAGGGGADADTNLFNNGGAGSAGGTALFTRRAITLTSTNGEIWGGGGGGGGQGGAVTLNALAHGGGGGGGGAGTFPGAGGPGGTAGGSTGTIIQGAPGASGSATGGGVAGTGNGSGGGPGAAANTGSNGLDGSLNGTGGAGGAAGNSIDGISFVTHSGAAGSELGPQVN